MKKAPRPGLALAAVFAATLVPITLPALQRVGASDFARGCIVGILLGAAMLLLALALKPRPA